MANRRLWQILISVVISAIGVVFYVLIVPVQIKSAGGKPGTTLRLVIYSEDLLQQAPPKEVILLVVNESGKNVLLYRYWLKDYSASVTDSTGSRSTISKLIQPQKGIQL